MAALEVSFTEFPSDRLRKKPYGKLTIAFAVARVRAQVWRRPWSLL
jgi:hypothetical protein